MIIPDFLKKDDVIGVTACSCGILRKVDKYERTLEHFKKDYKIIETPNVRTEGVVSSDALTRWNELKSLFLNKDVKMINIASGGDFLAEMLPYIDFDIIRNNVKWVGGSSDPTSLLYTITTKLDIATIYTPCNMSGMDVSNLHGSYKSYFEIIKGNLVRQEKYDKFEHNDIFDQDNEWIYFNGDIDVDGVLIGGCLDSIKDIIGTKFDGTKDFISRYKDKGIIWYFDVFSMSPETLCNTINQFRNAGYLEGCRAILIGKVKYPPDFYGITYEEAITRSIGDIPVVYKFDVGHVKPSMTMINGYDVHVVCNKNNNYLEYR